MRTYKEAILAKKRSKGMKTFGSFGGMISSFFLNSVKHIISTRRRENGLNCNGIGCPPFIVLVGIHGEIFALIAFFLIPKWRDHLKTTYDFIAITWSKAWFSNQHYTEDSYNQLHSLLSPN